MTPERPSDDRPSRAEVQQRISSLYDQAENATGNFNATRAMSKSARTRRGSASWSGSGGSDPAVDRVARKWFDVGRAQLGPTMPAVLPPDRMPRQADSPAAAQDRRPADAREGLALEAGRAPRPELSAGPAASAPELAAAARTVPELPAAAPVAELTARPMQPPPPTTGTMGVLPDGAMRPPTGTLDALSSRSMQPPPTGSMSLLPNETTGAPPAGAMDARTTGTMGVLPDRTMQPPPTGSMNLLPNETTGAPPAGTMDARTTGTMGVLPDRTMQPPPTGSMNLLPNGISGAPPAGAMDARTTGTTGVLPDRTTGGMQAPPTGTMRAVPSTGALGALSSGTAVATGAGAMGVSGSPGVATPPDGPVTQPAGGVPVARRRQAAAVQRPAKERTRGKLAQAGEMLARHAAQQSARPAEEPLPRPEAAQWQQHATGLFDTTPPLDGNSLFDASQAGAPGPATGAAVAESPASAYERKAAKALAFARAQIGKPCVWGATGPGSYDCSSLTQAAWRAADVALPRTTHEQVGSGAAIELAELEPGDLIFFYGEVSHVGLYAGNGTMVHAPSPGASIREESIFFAGPRAIHSAIRPA
ncbi:NlpC/P60 family protein [Streptomyces sp. NPDC014889]|uniref:C40 family peptidase n=1 Tax=Streptomyces sp. NPDC014889 TaxID=3364928 RepID=UPI0036F7FE1E